MTEFYKIFSIILIGGLLSCGESVQEAENTLSPRSHLTSAYQQQAKVQSPTPIPIFTGPSPHAKVVMLGNKPAYLQPGDQVALYPAGQAAESPNFFTEIGFGYVETHFLQPTPKCSTYFVGPYSEAFTDLNVNTWLSILSYAEGTGSCYDLMFGLKRLSSLAEHPNQCHTFGKTCTTAAGRYQFLASTWRGILRLKSFDNFGPENQDHGAIVLMENRGFTKASDSMNATEFRIALEQISWEWASLPPSRYGQGGKTFLDLWNKYQLWSRSSEEP